MVKQHDTKFEIIDSQVSQTLRLFCQDNLIGSKILLYAKDQTLDKIEGKNIQDVRDKTRSFFKNEL